MLSEEHKRKISRSRKGQQNNLGKRWKVKDTSKMKGSNTSFKKGHSPLSGMKGKKHSEKTKELLSKKRTKNPNSFWMITKKIRKTAPPKPTKCEICSILAEDLKMGLFLDHDHATGKFRGWLCTYCNSCLGYARDSTEILNMMISYLKKNNEYN